MADNKTKADRIHQGMPAYFKTRQNPNWRALIEALGEVDQEVADLIEEVRKQFFVATASRPYLDRLGANVNVSRPKFVGMSDDDFRIYVPVLAYKPKQVKAIFDELLDIFFFKETTTAFIASSAVEPYALEDGWDLDYIVDGINEERIKFSTSDFSSIGAATAAEIAAAINRQALYSFAIPFNDSVTKTNSVRIFTKTVGSTGSLQMIGGLANIVIQFQNFITNVGNQSTTIWTVTKVGDTTTFQWTGGSNPGLTNLEAGDIALIVLPGNAGSFPVLTVDASTNSFTFTNLFSTPGVYDHSIIPNSFVKFMTAEKAVIFTKNIRAVSWEVEPGEIIIEMPSTPPVVKRNLKGSAHINGVVSSVTSRVDDTTLQLTNASLFPLNGGKFVLQPLNEIKTRIHTGSVDEITSFQFNSSFDVTQRFSYTSKTGNVLSGITPNLPLTSDTFQVPITSATRDGFGVVTVTTSSPHTFSVGEYAIIDGTSGPLVTPVNGSFQIQSAPSSTSFTFNSPGDAGTDTGGSARVERIEMAAAGSLVYLTSANLNTGIFGPYMWDLNAPFVLSSATTAIEADIKAGNIVKVLPIAPGNNIPNQEGFLIFDFGTESQEGPVRYLLKPNANSISLDPAYVFLFNHDIGSAITVISRKGAHIMSGVGSEYAAYITDPSQARLVLEDLMKKVKSVGIFIEFLIRYPKQYYSTLDVYNSGVDPG